MPCSSRACNRCNRKARQSRPPRSCRASRRAFHSAGRNSILKVGGSICMCLAIPGKVSQIDVLDGVRSGRIQFGGITRQACLDFVPEANVGDYVMVHVGFAISVVDKDEAERTYALLESMGVLAEELAPGGADLKPSWNTWTLRSRMPWLRRSGGVPRGRGY